MLWKFTIIQYIPSPLETEIEEPPGWADMQKTIQRDAETHGIVFNFSATTLQFIEDAYWIIKEEYLLNGVDGNIGLRIEWLCDDCDGWQQFYFGKLDFQRFKETCGNDCYIEIGLEASEDEILIKNRMDTAVDLTSNIAYDNTTILTDYPGLNVTTVIPAKALLLLAEANNTPLDPPYPGYDIVGDIDFELFAPTNNGYVLPKFNNLVKGEIDTFSPALAIDYVTDFTPAPILDIKALAIDSGVTNYDIDFRLKGNINIKWNNKDFEHFSRVKVTLSKALKYATTFIDAFPVAQVGTYDESSVTSDTTGKEGNIPFDISWTGTIPLAVGDKVWPLLPIEIIQTTFVANKPLNHLTVQWDDASYFKVKNKSLTNPTPASTYLIHEAASRVFENITNNEYRFRSDYYGRVDSQPYSYAENGCGSLRTLTNGLQIRRAVLQDGSQPKVFLSPKDLYASLNAIDCVGMGIEGKDVRIEPIKYFYSDDVIFVADGVNEITTTVRPDNIYNQFNFGYDKFETESANGLDAIHTKRQYRLQIKHTDAKLEKISKIITDGYAIEATRRKFGTTEDWRYDQNIFMLCLNALYQVEQGNITAPENIFDPATVINYAVTPIRMALKWFAWVTQGYRNGGNITFSSGEGNYVAKGLLNTGCVQETAPIAENETITNFDTPFIEPEKVSFTFPMGLNEFVDVAAKKYGKIQYRRYPDEDWKFGWIDSMKFSPNEGEGEFSLITCK